MTAITLAPETMVSMVPNMMNEIQDWPTKARSLTVINDETNEAACEMLFGIKSLMRKVDETFDPICAAAFATHQKATGTRAEHRKPLEQAERLLKSAIGAYDVEKQRLYHLDRRRHEEEVAAVRAEAKRAADQRLEREIEAAEAAGAAVEEIEAMIKAPVEVQPVYIPPPPPARVQPKGISVPMRTVAVVENKALLVAFLAANSQYLNLIDINQGFLDKMANAMGTAMNWPGVTVTKIPAVRAGGVR